MAFLTFITVCFSSIFAYTARKISINKMLNMTKTIKSVFSEIILRKTSNTIVDKDNGSITITYNHLGSTKEVYVPYKQSLFRKMNQSDVFLKIKGELKKLNQSSGVPYVITARMLGGENLIVRNKLNDIENQFGQDEYIDFEK